METRDSSENSETEKLHQELGIRGRYYFKGLGMIIGVGLLSNLELFATVEATQKLDDYIRRNMDILRKCYDSIPFGQLTDHPDYDIFISVRDAVSRLQSEVDQILAGKKDIHQAHEHIQYIIEKGNEYRRRLMAILKALRRQPGFEDYGLQTTDLFGRHWDSAI